MINPSILVEEGQATDFNRDKSLKIPITQRRENFYIISNLTMIVAFIACLIVFNVALTTPYTHLVTLYFIPDMGLCAGNIFMSAYLIRHIHLLDNFLTSKLVSFLISFGFYFNIGSAIFYALLFIDKQWGLSLPLMDIEMMDTLWRQFPDIMKFKVAATF